MAGSAAAEDSEPLFVLEPLPELSYVISSVSGANPLILLFSAGAILYCLVKFSDPMVKISTSSILNLGVNFYVTESLFYSMIFTSIFILGFFLVMAAMNWGEIQAALGMDKARILSISSFILSTWILIVLGKAIGMPTGSGMVVCASTTAFLWWTYYSLEPSTR